jgi:hypothetical protein
MSSPEPYTLTGEGIESRPEVFAVKKELRKIDIDLSLFGIEITRGFIKPRPFGFDFNCAMPQALLALARRKAATLNEDDRDTPIGRAATYFTHGEGLRQIGTGPKLHLEVAMDGRCNVHIDSHGFVVAQGQYDFNRALEHIYWDLGSDNIFGLYGSFGNQGQVGPMIAPMVGVDGKTRLVFGMTGHW